MSVGGGIVRDKIKYDGSGKTLDNHERTCQVWHPSPSLESDKLISYYKKLSKFRLTCK